MDPSVKMKDPNCNAAPPTAIGQTTVSAIASICNSDSFSIIPPPHLDLVSANSIELNAAASLSDDSGVPLTTNSSISSGDSYRLGMCKLEIEMVESDGEVSQFDSLENCSEGGMSAENFNTLKKGPLAPIDPPPEFQDSPQTTLVRSISKNIVNSLRRWTSSQSSFEHLKDHSDELQPINFSVGGGGGGVNLTDCGDVNDGVKSNECGLPFADDDKTLKDSYAINKHLYSSDSILNSHTDNIYDEPNNIISTSLGNSIDVIESDSSSPLPPPPPPVSIVKIKQTLCPYYQDHTRYFKAIPSEQDNITTAAQKFNLSGLSEIHDYDLYYGTKRNVYQQYENSLQRKLLYSPLNHSHHCHNHHYHAGMSSSGNRPNSRNSLNSRLSSSHNSLSVSSANKPDDSIFITQAMSHDALLTREISDFYNVPIDSDIYAFPVDMIQSEGECQHSRYEDADSKTRGDPTKQQAQQSIDTAGGGEHGAKCHQHKSNRRTNRHKRKKRASNGGDGGGGGDGDCEGGEKPRHQTTAITTTITSRSKYRAPVSSSGGTCDERTSPQEPLHMTLDEVKQFYHTLYSDTKSVTGGLHRVQGNQKTNAAKSSNETIWSVSSTRSRGNFAAIRDKNVANNLKVSSKNTQKLSTSDNADNINNNNNLSTISNHNSQQQQQQQKHCQPPQVTNAKNPPDYCLHHHQDKQPQLPPPPPPPAVANNKQQLLLHNEKKSQFTLNLKQKFCSIFRIRKNQNRCRANSSELEENIANSREQGGGNSTQSAEDKRKKFQSRALPPLPKKVETITDDCEENDDKKLEPRSFHFTSSIEKVKDYGWYWGPLSSEAAEKVLSNEPDGSFIVRDSSDDHYIFSLSFKLNNCVRHVRIEQDKGTFSFGTYAKFKSQTITEFIEKAVEHSRSGRYLFFLHRRPEHGPMRVQLTNPVSRFKHVQSLQHMCRFVILKAVIRKDLIQTLPLPRRLLDYLNYKHCYSEQVESDSSHSQISGEGSL